MYSFTPVESPIVKDEVKDTVASAGAGFPAPSSSGHLTDTNTGPMVNEQNDQQGSQGKAPSDLPVASPAAATAAPSTDKKAGKPSEHNICQVPGCGADLRSNKEYYQRYRICLPHFHIEEMLVDGVPQRFCQQCGRFHLLNRFDGKKRSCREKLAYHNARRRKHNTSDYGTSTPTSSIACLPNCTRSLTSGSLRSDTIRGSHFSQMGQDVPILATCATSAKKRFRMSLDNQLQQQHDFAQEDALGNFRLQLQLAQAQQDMQHQAAHQHLFSSLRGMSASAVGSALPTPRSQLHDNSMHSGKPPLVATTYNPRLTAASSAPLPRPAGAGPMPLDLVDCMLLEDMSLCNILLSGSDRDSMHYERDSYSGNMIRAASMSANNMHGALSLPGPNRGSIPSHGTATIMTRANDAISADGYGPYTAAYASLSGWATPSDMHAGQPASASELRPMVEALPRGTTFTLHQPITHKQHTMDGRNLAGDVSIGILFEEINQASGPGWWRQREVEEEQRPRW